MHPNHPPLIAVRDAVTRAIAEDVLPLGDLTASLVSPDAVVRAAFVARAEGVLAGRLCADEAFAQLDPTIVITWMAEDGDALEPGHALAIIEGPLAPVLTGERTALNFLCHLSGVATLTRRFVQAADAGAGEVGKVRVWDTRKTIPGLRALEKAAVRAGGGANHRGNLSEMILVKDNHLAGMSITDAVRRARLRWPARTIEVECDRIEQVHEAVDAGAGLVLLDNMAPDEVAACVSFVRDAPRAGVLVEVSGGVTLETIGRYAAAGADLISSSVITQSAPALDIGLDLDWGG